MSYPSPLKSIRLKCLDCCNGSSEEVRLCHLVNCALHLFRSGHKPLGQAAPSRVKTIRKKCLACSYGNTAEVRGCEVLGCPIHPFRMGKNPNCKRSASAVPCFS